ncbi:Hsp70 family chaperone LHS1 [Sugiyamaella lignohabitans]|uniref:Hsp70 family chaperone LHS1 n=1 Tax=Sugiyamaella lignohabitans TaxID=796027 RepID=A0A161HLU7_9ASCO|nr:Hsp70 family chaperone LHS1 [Sugiyamaella lignohabitans]ANB14447.1 Hsp70 family chaperone LHS1 [Sugiyamaella lignohabitans]
MHIKLFKSTFLGFLFILFTSLQLIQCAVLGIDFGQEYTKGSLVAPGAPFEVIMTSDSKRKDLSGITFKKAPGSGSGTFERIYGNSAAAVIQRFPATSPFYLKPLLGQSLDSPAAKWYSEQFPAVKLVPSNNNRSTIAIQIFDDIYSVEEIVAMSFSEIKGRASKVLTQALSGSSGYLKDTALSVPPYYSIQQRKALQDAVEIADLRLISLVNDGAAVAANFAASRQFENDKKEHHIIYDIGAGSTTATLVEIYQADLVPEGSPFPRSHTVIDVIGVGYDTELGGHVLTQSVRNILIDKFLEANPKVKRNDLLNDHRALARFWREAERVKFVLSANSETQSSIESAYNDISLKTHVSRVEFEDANRHLFDKVPAPILDALNNPLNNSTEAFDFSKVSSIILTGGSTRIPIVQQELLSLINARDPTEQVTLAKNVNADEAAVLGTALRGVGISKIFRSKDMAVIDRAIWDYSAEIDGEVATIFPRGTPLDSKFVLPFDSSKDDFKLVLYENGKEFVRHNINGVQSAIKRLLNDPHRECISNVSVEAEFHLSNSRIVELLGTYAKCESIEKVVSTESSQQSSTSDSADVESSSETDNASSGTTSSATTASVSPTAKPPKVVKKSVSMTNSFDGPRPMGSASKQSALSRLRALDRLDADRLSREEARNTFESRLYRVRELLESEESAQQKLAEFGEWFDYDSEKASIKVLQEKLAELNALADSYNKETTVQQIELPKETGSVVEPTMAGPEIILEPPVVQEQQPFENEKLADVYQGIKEVAEMLDQLGIDIPNREAVAQILGGSTVPDSTSNLKGIAELLRSKLQAANLDGSEPADSGDVESRLNDLRHMIKKAADIIKTESSATPSVSISTSPSPKNPQHDDL